MPGKKAFIVLRLTVITNEKDPGILFINCLENGLFGICKRVVWDL
jgi:hypothetical protein